MLRKFWKKDKNTVATPASSPAQTTPGDLFRVSGDERLRNNDYNGAVVMYDEALRCTPADVTLLLSRSLAHMMSTPPKLDLALQDVGAAIQREPTSSQGWLQKGEIHLKMEDIKNAEKAFVKAVEFSHGLDRHKAQRSLGDVRSRRDQTPSIRVEPQASGTSSTVATPPPPVLQSSSTTTPARAVSDSPTPASSSSNSQMPGGTSRDTIDRSPPAAQSSNPDPGVQVHGPEDPPPPSYTPNLNNPNPTVRALSQQAVITQFIQFQNSSATRNRGSLSIRPYTIGSIDAVKLVYVGMTFLELTARELGTPTYQHPTFGSIAVDAFNYPGNTFLDMDCETSGYYDGKLPGTVSISGYSEEYRAHQLLRVPLIHLTLESESTLPPMALDKIVDRIRLLQRQPTLEDNETLRETLGLSQLTALQLGFSSGGRQRQIEAICMALNRSIYDTPSRFIDFSNARTFSNNTLGTATQGVGLRNFLFQILIGAELLIRLRKEPITTSYTGLINGPISALMVVTTLWMENVTIQGPRTITIPPLTLSTSTTVLLPLSPQYLLIAEEHQRQAEGLIRFGELLSWPYMDEARHYIENAYRDLISRNQAISFDICDWLYGLVLPGKKFRHRIMCCLLYASPSIRSLGPAPYYDNGLVVKNKSYWPKRSVLGRVLGGLRNPRSVCGWIGPVPAPESGPSGWILLNARHVDIPVPISTTQTSLQSLGFGEDEIGAPEAFLQSITDPNQWIQASPPPRPANDSSRSVFKGIHLSEAHNTTTPIVGTNTTNTPIGVSKECSVSLDFEVNGIPTRYTLYSNPIFVYAPPCVGTHPLHKRQVQNYLNNVVRTADLKDADVPSDKLVIVDALGQGEEVVARAWCAERARHAVIRRDGECCFACATGVVAARTGLGFNVLIWSR